MVFVSRVEGTMLVGLGVADRPDCDLRCLPMLSSLLSFRLTAAQPSYLPRLYQILRVAGFNSNLIISFRALSRAVIRSGRRTAPAVSSRSHYTDGVLPHATWVAFQTKADSTDLNRFGEKVAAADVS